MIPTAASHVMAGLIPNSKIVLYPNASHGAIWHSSSEPLGLGSSAWTNSPGRERS
jgi:hypothetical protein